MEIPFHLISSDFYAIYCPSNFVKSHHQKITISGYEGLENLSFRENFTKEDLNDIKEIVKKINLKVER